MGGRLEVGGRGGRGKGRRDVGDEKDRESGEYRHEWAKPSATFSYGEDLC